MDFQNSTSGPREWWKSTKHTAKIASSTLSWIYRLGDSIIGRFRIWMDFGLGVVGLLVWDVCDAGMDSSSERELRRSSSSLWRLPNRIGRHWNCSLVVGFSSVRFASLMGFMKSLNSFSSPPVTSDHGLALRSWSSIGMSSQRRIWFEVK